MPTTTERSPLITYSTPSSRVPAESVSDFDVSSLDEDLLGSTPTATRPLSIRRHDTVATSSSQGTQSHEPGRSPARPPISRPMSLGAGIPSAYAGVSASLPSTGWAGGTRDRQDDRVARNPNMSSTKVPPQSDYLANWETLADLVMPSPQAGPSRNRTPMNRGNRLQSPALSSMKSARSQKTPAKQVSGRTGAQDIPSVGSVAEDEELEFSGVLSTSPPTLDQATPSFSSMGEVFDSPARQASPAPSSTPVQQTERPPDPTPMADEGAPEQTATQPQRRPPNITKWQPPPWVIAIMKCGIAYLIAELFTFVPQLSTLLSMRRETDVHGRVRPVPAYSAHMVATIVVYFNPARTKGGMILSTRYCMILATMAAIVSLISFGILRFFDHFSPSQGSNWDWASEAGDWVVCVLCIGGSMAGLAWAKQWVGNPSFNTGCSMAAVTLFTVVVKEGGWVKLKEVLIIVLIGACITNFVSFSFYPSSATTKLQGSMSKSLNSFSTLLDIMTSAFLLEQPHAKENRMPLAAAVKAHGDAFQSLKANLAEAKHERLIDPRVRGIKLELYDAALGSMARLAQHLAAMRSSTRFQEALLRANRDGRIDLDRAEKRDHHMAESVIYELNDLPTITVEGEADVEKAVSLFLQLQRMTGNDLDTLVDRCDDALDAIEGVITENAPADLADIRMAVANALRDFSRSSSRAIKRIYAGPRRRRGIYHSDSSGSSDEDDDLQLSLGDYSREDGPNEVIFLVYFFMFTMEEFARELLFLLGTVNDITNAPQMTAFEQLGAIIGRRPRGEENFLYKQFQKLVPVDPSKLQPPLFPRTQAHERGTLLTPARADMDFRGRLYHWAWELGARLREPDMRYAIKTGLAGAMLAAPAFAETTRKTFLEYRGEWALIAYFATMSPTLGQTNFLSFFRIVGTILGGSVAVLACLLFPENPVALPIFGFLFSLPCFYIITQMPAYGQAGRFILLTYNLTCLYSYNLREKDLSPVEIAFRRSTSVIAGVIWAAIVSRWWWPYTARRELRMGLGDFCLDLSYLYSKLVAAYTRGVDDPSPSTSPPAPGIDDERAPLLPLSSARHHLGPGVIQFMAMELHLQSQLADLRGLLAHAKNEPRLKGPFPFMFYQEVLLSCERMLDRLHSMRCVTTRMEWDKSIREAFVLPVNPLQREMAGNIILYFYTLSAGFRLRIPMPPYLPPAETSRRRLVGAIRDLDIVKRRSVRGGGRHLLFFAYALAMQEVIAELELVGAALQDAFGVISHSGVRGFEELFVENGQ